VVASVLAVPSGRAVADAFLKAMRVYGVPSEVLTDNGKQFTGRFTKPRPAEVLFERVCRENGITARLIKPYSPTTTGKIERWHQTLRRELLDRVDPFVDLPSAQAAISAWVQTYNHARPHQSLDMATPASLFRPNAQPEALVITGQPNNPGQDVAEAVPATDTAAVNSGLVLLPSAGAVEFDTVIAASGLLAVIPAVQRISLGPNRGGQRAHVWVDEYTVHVLIDGELVKTVPSNLDAEDLRDLSMRGARPAGAPPATASVGGAGTLPAAAVIEVDRHVDSNGYAELAKHRLRIGAELARRKVTLRLDGHLIHVVYNDVLAKTLPSPVPADQHTKIRGRPDRPQPNTAPSARPDERATQGPQRRRRHGRPPTPTGRTHLHRQDRHHPRRGHPLPGHLRRRPAIHPPKDHRTPNQAVESQDSRSAPISADVKNVPRL
jgi:hypothetical protein